MESGLALLLAFLTGAVLVGAVFLMLQLESWRQSQGERFYVAVVALLLLGAIESQTRRLMKRRLPFSLSTTREEQIYSLVVLLVMGGAAVVLFGFACYLP